MAGLLPVLVLLTLPALLAAQGRPAKPGGPRGISVTAQQDLVFGVLLPGATSTVYVDDVTRRAEWVIRTDGGATVSLQLPRFLESATGDRIPLSFGFGDAGFLQGGTVSIVLYDPERRFDVFVPADPGFGELFLGGTALPSTDVPPGTYTATITIIVTP
ncbi:MAG TPA: hypothetical protein VF039_11605 [Longimicrobiales bacterium]